MINIRRPGSSQHLRPADPDALHVPLGVDTNCYYISVYLPLSLYIYIYREREWYIHMCIYIYIHITYGMYTWWGQPHDRPRTSLRATRREGGGSGAASPAPRSTRFGKEGAAAGRGLETCRKPVPRARVGRRLRRVSCDVPSLLTAAFFWSRFRFSSWLCLFLH